MKLFNCYKYGTRHLINESYRVIPFKKFEVGAIETVNFCTNLVSQTYGTKRAIEKAVKCGGDTDTNASIIGEYQNYMFKDLTEEDIQYVNSKLDPFLLDILTRFNENY